jgi:hypothetical protein
MTEIGDKLIKDAWRDLGIYYDFDNRMSVNQWRFYGSEKGLKDFASLILEYAENPDSVHLSEHEHFGPYRYLKIMTWDTAVIKREYIAGTVEDLKRLSQLILDKLSGSGAGQTFTIDKDYGYENTATTKFFVMSDDFDPASMDELIMSGRQAIVNNEVESVSNS